MSDIWTPPEGNDERINQLLIKFEENLCDIKLLQSRQARIRNELREFKEQMKGLKALIKNLKNSKHIVSLEEFGKIRDGIAKLKRQISDCESCLRSDDGNLKQFIKHGELIEVQIEKMRKNLCQVLKFKKTK